MAQLNVAIVWFRRDLRLYDNPALVAALNSARTVIPLYIWAPEEEGQFQPGRQTRWWSKHSVMCLAQSLEQLGSRLVIRRARESVEGLKAFITETGAETVFFNHLYDSISMVRDQQVKDDLRSNGILVSSFNADLLYEPWEVLDEQQQPYTTFKSYWDRCLAMPYAPPLPLPEPTGPLPAVPEHYSSMSVHEVDWFFTREQEASTEALTHRWDPAGSAAVARLEAFLEQGLPSFEHDRAKTDRESTTMLSPWIHFGLPSFEHDRAKTDRESTTMLSPWIHFGSISVRHIYYRVAQKHAEWQAAGRDKGRSCLDFLQQMGYREYSRYLAFHFPFITERSMLAHLRAVPWRLDQDAFKAWRQGLTGYPLVDAGMRQLWSMGWCHNRVRVVASHFMVKHLLLPWQWGLKHLWDCQIDADLECDALGWQYVSGCLSDAHPFSYMIDMEQEWRRFDPDGHYVRRWLPVLSQLPNEFIHQPWAAPPEVLEDAGVELGFNYPWPIIAPDAAKEGVALASAVVERCAPSSGSSGSSSGTGYSLTPHKEPYRPPTDPSLMSSFLAASQLEPSSWRDKLPPLYIHSATGHPLSIRHSAQQRPMWGPSMQQQDGTGFDHMGRFYGLYRGRMGQQQLLLGPAAAAAAAGAKRGLRQGSGGSGELSGGTFAGGDGELSYSQIDSESGDNGAALMEDVSSSAAGSQELRWQQQQQQQQCEVEVEDGDSELLPGSGSGKRFKLQQQLGAGAFGVGGSSGGGRAESSELLVVPSVSAGGSVGADGLLAGGGFGGRMRFNAAAVAVGDDEDADMMDDDYEEDEEQQARRYYAGRQMHGRRFAARPAASLSTACSHFKGGAGAGAMEDGAVESIGEDDVMQQVEQQQQQQQQQRGDEKLLLVAEAARLQDLQLEASSRPRQ
uniref:Photolyase/cryptochrome alpha/beta domain-containing protein n=1 Tax=Tetradesmus obliquus TaxID=3088 RepID=A0A383WNN2_TETOB